MRKIRNWIIGLAIVSLLAVGVVAVAGNGFGGSATWNSAQTAAGDCGACNSAADCALNGRDADGDGISNSEDADWVRPLDGTGYGAQEGRRSGCTGPLLGGNGLGAGGHGRMGQRWAGGVAHRSCI